MPQDRPDKKTDYVLVYDGEHGVRLAPPGGGRRQTLEERLGWAPRETWEIDDLPIATAEEAEPASVRRRGGLWAGAAGLCVLGVALALTVRSPRLEPPAAANAVTQLPALQPAPAPPAPSQVAAAAPAPEPAATLRAAEPAAPPLRLAQATVVAAPAATPEGAKLRPAARPESPRHAAGAPKAKPRRVELASNTRQPPRTVAPVRKDRADCGQSHADAMVCGDTELAAADRRLAQALQAAVTSGASLEDLRAQQDAWRIQRDAASHISRAAVSRAYERRIEELKTRPAAEPPY